MIAMKIIWLQLYANFIRMQIVFGFSERYDPAESTLVWAVSSLS